MNKKDENSILSTLIMLLILLFAFFIAFIPHMSYSLPVHIDEWNQVAYSQAIFEEGSIDFEEPFYGYWGANVNYSIFSGYSLLINIIHQISGVDLIHMPIYLPGIIFVMTVLAVYCLARRSGFGWEAAFFTCLIPTTVGILGPGFMVPVAMGLLFVPLTLFLVGYQHQKTSYILCFLFGFYLFFMHPPSALMTMLITVPYVMWNMRNDFKRGLYLLVSLLLPCIFPVVLMFNYIQEIVEQMLVRQSLPTYVTLPDIIQMFGYVPLFCGILGVVVIVLKNYMSKNYGLILSLVALLILLISFYRFHFGLSILYLRGLLFMLLMLGIIAGAGLNWIKTVRLSGRNAGHIFVTIIMLSILVMSIPGRINSQYYHMIDRNDYRAFTWIRDNISEMYNFVVVDPWKATAFATITNKNIYHRIFLYQEPIDDIAYSFLNSNCRDTSFITDTGISLIYTIDKCVNNDLIQVYKDVYIVNSSDPEYYKNLLSNPGFSVFRDNAHPAEWSTWSEYNVPDFLYSSAGLNGGACVGIKMYEVESVEEWPYSIWLQNINVKPGETYHIGGWIKTENVSGEDGVMIIPHWKGPRDSWIGATEFMDFVKGTNDWTYYEGIVTVPEGTEYCTFCCLMAGCSGKAWFDDMLFMEKPVHSQ